MKLKAVINLFGGPGSGKSTVAAGVFHALKVAGLNVEMCSEYAKDLVFEERKKLLDEDQLYIFAKQHRRLSRYQDTVDFVVMDSPLLLSRIYFSTKNLYDPEVFNTLVESTFHKYPNVNFLLNRSRLEFASEGRLQDEYVSKALDIRIQAMLNSLSIPHLEVRTTQAVDVITTYMLQQEVKCAVS